MSLPLSGNLGTWPVGSQQSPRLTKGGIARWELPSRINFLEHVTFIWREDGGLVYSLRTAARFMPDITLQNVSCLLLDWSGKWQFRLKLKTLNFCQLPTSFLSTKKHKKQNTGHINLHLSVVHFTEFPLFWQHEHKTRFLIQLNVVLGQFLKYLTTCSDFARQSDANGFKTLHFLSSMI